MAHTFTVYTENKPDVLARVVLLFHRRAVRICSLQMAPAEDPEVLKIVISVEAGEEQSLRLKGDLYKLVNVLSVESAGEQPSLPYPASRQPG